MPSADRSTRVSDCDAFQPLREIAEANSLTYAIRTWDRFRSDAQAVARVRRMARLGNVAAQVAHLTDAIHRAIIFRSTGGSELRDEVLNFLGSLDQDVLSPRGEAIGA